MAKKTHRNYAVEYQTRMKAENRCTKCGKPTAGYITDGGKFKQYVLCDHHRKMLHIQYVAKRLEIKLTKAVKAK